jgi:thiaminase/transcriptional activator TenA
MASPPPSPSARLRRLADPIWAAQHRHPFVRGIGDGTLAPAKFALWVKQDYLFLTDYARLMALGAARAPDLATMAGFAEQLTALTQTEMGLHRAYSAEFGITPEELEREGKLPTTQGYTDFLVRTAATGDFAELVAALLPCMWGFAEIGERLAAGGLPADKRYADWVAMYASPEFATLAGWCRDLLDRAAGGASPEGARRVEGAFLTSSRWELAFWEMAWRGERWPG